MTHRYPFPIAHRAQACVLAALLGICMTHGPMAQTIDDIPAELVDITPGQHGEAATAAGGSVSVLDLGERPALAGDPVAQTPVQAEVIEQTGVAEDSDASDLGIAARAVRQAHVKRANTLRASIERVVFNRRPIGVALPVGQERLITLPSPAVLHVPGDIEVAVRLESIGRTVYATALRPFAPLRIIAELIETGEQVPLDLVANEGTVTASEELEVFLGERVLADRPSEPALLTDHQDQEQQQAADMVQLTRHAARALYAPRRLAYGTPGVTQVKLDTTPVQGLIRGALVETTPIAQWRSGNLWVTAVVVRNLARSPLEIPLENLRGQWLAATAQHGRIGPAGSERDTTAIYLVCQRPFESCR